MSLRYLPAAGTAHQASNGFMVDRDSNDTSLESIPGKWIPAACTRYPVVASMATRPFLSSAARNHAKVASEPSVARFSGSKFLMGAVLPTMPSKLLAASAVDRAFFYVELMEVSENNGRFHSCFKRHFSLIMRTYILRDRSKCCGRASKTKDGSSNLHDGSSFCLWWCVKTRRIHLAWRAIFCLQLELIDSFDLQNLSPMTILPSASKWHQHFELLHGKNAMLHALTLNICLW